MNIEYLIKHKATIYSQKCFNPPWIFVKVCVQWDIGLFFKKESLQLFAMNILWYDMIREDVESVWPHSGVHEDTL